MEKVFITGFSGFVSSHYLNYLDDHYQDIDIYGIDINEPLDFSKNSFKNIKWRYEKVDLLQNTDISKILGEYQPDYILHLASLSSVAISWKEPSLCFQNNTNIFLNILESVRQMKLKTRILSVGSSEEYGNVSEKEIPLTENSLLHPVSPYAVARISQELLSKVYAEGYGIDIVLTRSFNHIGPRQKSNFVIPSFARQLVEMKKKGNLKGKIEVGDISIIRDFLDVRDVVKAYDVLLRKGRKGEIYNVCGNRGISLKDIIIKMADILKLDVEISVNPELIRPNDNKIIIGSYDKIKKEFGWKPDYSLENSLADIIDYWDKVL